MSKALKLTGGPEVAETVRFVEIMDKFFDSLNVSIYKQGIKKRKTFQLPYTSGKDKRLEVCLYERSHKVQSAYNYQSGVVHVIIVPDTPTLQWLEKEFLSYLDTWEKWAQSIPNLTKTERNNLLLSSETRQGLRMTCKYLNYVMPHSL